ncbi:MAG: dihydroorotate dehydrogenase electron transfer subunit [Thermodesulfobacteriota bacterium]|nr:dihydroorotate dehydrogenase electron transfer subunit [Thermodesulfobacteriota bacterium]
MMQHNAKVLENRRINDTCLQLGLSCPSSWAAAVPGQFVMLRLRSSGVSAPFLPRPFSIYRVTGDGRLGILYRVVGRATCAMAALDPGDDLDVLGPLGNGFSCSSDLKRAFLVAGGIGVPPVAFLARHLAGRKGATAVDCTVFLGGATASDILCEADFSSIGMTVHIATEDGSAGTKGLVTDILAPALEDQAPDAVFACGPPGMLRAVGSMATTRKVACQVSIETMMACGMGACMGCAVRSADNQAAYKHACTDGPVFDFAAIDLSHRLFCG